MGVLSDNAIIGASNASGYDIEQSMYIGDGAQSGPKLQRTCGTPEGTNALTISSWYKKGSPNTGSKTIFSWIVKTTSSTLPYAYLEVLNDFPGEAASLHWAGYSGSGYAWNEYWSYDTKLRDWGAWMHVHLKISGTTAELYLNGNLTKTSSFNTGYYPISGSKMQIGCNDSNQLASAYFADTYWIDGQALAPTEMGETNEDTGQWVPIKYTGTYAGNSAFLNYSDSSDFGTDSSGLGNDFTATSIPATQQKLDSPTNNFATLNPLAKSMTSNLWTWAEGNLKASGSASTTGNNLATIGVSSGKWYWEVLYPSPSGTPMKWQAGVYLVTSTGVNDKACLVRPGATTPNISIDPGFPSSDSGQS
ncbi:MAG: hypothetical protein QF535_23740, partial [Anaerolineales bacterium]|nr:hypothetical protein [Anaerolineales bacterium]